MHAVPATAANLLICLSSPEPCMTMPCLHASPHMTCGQHSETQPHESSSLILRRQHITYQQACNPGDLLLSLIPFKIQMSSHTKTQVVRIVQVGKGGYQYLCCHHASCRSPAYGPKNRCNPCCSANQHTVRSLLVQALQCTSSALYECNVQARHC